MSESLTFLLDVHFADPRHRRLFAAAAKLIERGQIANPVTLSAFFKQDDELAEIGGTQYLAELSNNLVAVINAVDYARIIHDDHIRRELITIGEDTVNSAYQHDMDQDAKQQIELAEQKLFNLATAGASEGGFISFASSLTKAHRQYRSRFPGLGRDLSGSIPAFAISIASWADCTHPIC